MLKKVLWLTARPSEQSSLKSRPSNVMQKHMLGEVQRGCHVMSKVGSRVRQKDSGNHLSAAGG